jgi:secondary thiamine-phosphate synthase enzyme
MSLAISLPVGLSGRNPRPRLAVRAATVQVRTRAALEFTDLTETLAAFVRRSGVVRGVLNVQTLHTTTAIVVNEAEPLLHRDVAGLLEFLAPTGRAYRHDDFEARANVSPDERRNGHSHCRAILLRTAETLNLAEGRLQLGRWQRVFLLELDSGRERTVSLVALGLGGSGRRPRPLRRRR